jgi:hypothetical protein
MCVVVLIKDQAQLVTCHWIYILCKITNRNPQKPKLYHSFVRLHCVLRRQRGNFIEAVAVAQAV